MSDPKNLIHEIHQRSVWQVLGIYLAVSWVALQVVDVLNSTIGLPAWVPAAAFWLLIVGLPVVVTTAFVQKGIRSRKSPVAGHHRLFTWRNAGLAGGAAFALLGVATAGYMLMRSLGIGPAGTLVARGLLEERAPVLLADFESPTGDSILARTVTEALRVDLAQSDVLTLVEQARTIAALERMERPRDEPLDSDLAREVAVREGIPAVISGEVRSVGRGFVLSARIVATADGAELVSHRETAVDSAAILAAIDALSKKLRERAGESLRSVRTAPRLQDVTTGSLEALRKYSEGIRITYLEGGGTRAIARMQEAVEADSTFAMAWRALGVMVANRGQERSRALTALRKAYELRDRLPDRERYHVAAQYHFVMENYEAVVVAYEALLDLEPDDDRALNNLAYAMVRLRHYRRAEELALQAVAADTLGSLPYATLTNALGHQGRYDDVRRWAEIGRRRLPNSFYIELNDSHAIAASGEWEAAETRFRERRQERPGDLAWEVLTAIDLAALAAARGRLDEAEAHLEDAMAANEARGLGAEYLRTATWAALLDVTLRGRPDRGIARIDTALAKYPLDDLDPLDRPYLDLADLYLRAGNAERAKALVAAFEAAVPPEYQRLTGVLSHRLAAASYDEVRGHLALAEGRASDAAELFRRSDIGDCTICALPPLAGAYEAAGIADSAMAVYERYLATPMLQRLWAGDAYHRGPTLERLGQLHDEASDYENAAKYYAMFVELWAEADEELQPRVRAAQRRLEEILAERG